jgi:hypothetical protein
MAPVFVLDPAVEPPALFRDQILQPIRRVLCLPLPIDDIVGWGSSLTFASRPGPGTRSAAEECVIDGQPDLVGSAVIYWQHRAAITANIPSTERLIFADRWA